VRALSSPLRKQLESSVLAARRAAESASRAVIDGLGVFQSEKPGHLDAEQAVLRNGLRQKWRQFGGDDQANSLLVTECAYEQWHRLLFARFLAENGLLLHPVYKAPVTLGDCDELAAELGEPDGWSVAARFAAEILPGIFPLDDPCVRLRLAPEGRQALEQILEGLPADIFAAEDSLGWVYQFWQKNQKDEVNSSGRRISGPDLGPVTQLFTENYMVRFLLENSLGAWWATRHPDSPLIKKFDYLRFGNDATPANESLASWPDRIADVTVMDPCCGSGHFLVEAFTMLWQMRAEEEGTSPAEAQDAVLRDNLFGLDIDQRCVQITAFAVALAAWRSGGYRSLPSPSIGCSGTPVAGQLRDWQEIEGLNDTTRDALGALHAQFREAPNLGSLIDPRRATPEGELFSVDYDQVAPVLGRLLAREKDPQRLLAGVNAAGLARVGSMLSRQFTLVITNVPYLSIQRMPDRIADFLLTRYPNSANDLATVFIERCLQVTAGTAALVVPIGWLYLRYYAGLRKALLSSVSWDVLAPLGKGAFETISGEVVQSALVLFSGDARQDNVAAVDATSAAGPDAKAEALRRGSVLSLSQNQLRKTPDTLLAFGSEGAQQLSVYTTSWHGLVTSDNARFLVRFWEVPKIADPWRRFLTAPKTTAAFAGRESLLRWEDGRGDLVRNSGATNINPKEVLGQRGVLVGQASLRVTLYWGEMFSHGSVPVIPYNQRHLPALWAYMASTEYPEWVRRINQKVIVDSGYMIKAPFDLGRWDEVAREKGPLPEPWSDDPTQWLFEGRPEVATAPLQVAVGRLVGYRWPGQEKPDDLDQIADADGIVCLPPVAGEPPAAERLQHVLAAAFGGAWSPTKARELLERTGSKKKTMTDWLRDDCFKQHCALFSNRPFIWHIWDGLKDGFSALVNYHQLDRKNLEKLTYTYLGQDWVERQRAETREQVAGAEDRLSAALNLQHKLVLILEGEPPYDIYVRWKNVDEQPVGWEPDLNDGVRLNIRPFVEGGVLRSPFNIHWHTDRGKNPREGERRNDVHVTLSQKRKARERAGLS
jgi:hypothetical protein